MKKVIQILCHTFENDVKLKYHVFGSWPTRQAKSILQYSTAYQCEVWYAVRHLKKTQTITHENITFKLFPAKTLHPLLESFFGVINAPELLKNLEKEDPQKTIIHFQGERGTLLHTVLNKYSNFPITIQYHGYGQPPWLNFLEKYLIIPLEKKNFPKIKHFFVHIQKKIKYLKSELHIDPQRISFQNNGVDFNTFIPLSKRKSRTRNHLPLDKFIMLYIGAMVQTKGVDRIMKAYQFLKKKYPQLYLVFIGANTTDPLYKEAKDIADKVVTLIKNQETVHYYNAADVYCFYGNRKTIEYAGVGTAPTEALACNLNVVSTNLIHFPDKINTIVGLIPKDFDDFVNKIEYLILHPKTKFNARNIVAPYASYEYTTKNIIDTYDQLLY